MDNITSIILGIGGFCVVASIYMMRLENKWKRDRYENPEVPRRKEEWVEDSGKHAD